MKIVKHDLNVKEERHDTLIDHGEETEVHNKYPRKEIHISLNGRLNSSCTDSLFLAWQ